jgi:hypothetical protein
MTWFDPAVNQKLFEDYVTSNLRAKWHPQDAVIFVSTSIRVLNALGYLG